MVDSFESFLNIKQHRAYNIPFVILRPNVTCKINQTCVCGETTLKSRLKIENQMFFSWGMNQLHHKHIFQEFSRKYLK